MACFAMAVKVATAMLASLLLFIFLGSPVVSAVIDPVSWAWWWRSFVVGGKEEEA